MINTGEICVRKEAAFRNSNIIITQPKGKIVLIKINHEYMSVQDNVNDQDNHDNNRHTLKNWCLGQDLSTYVDNSVVSLNNKFVFDSSLLESFTSDFIEETYIPKEYDLPFVAEWIKPFYNGRYSLITFHDQIYVLQGEVNQVFNPLEHTFLQNDRRLVIKYVLLINLVCC